MTDEDLDECQVCGEEVPEDELTAGLCDECLGELEEATDSDPEDWEMD